MNKIPDIFGVKIICVKMGFDVYLPDAKPPHLLRMNLSNATAALKKYYGYDQFRPLQADIIQAVYDKKDSLVLMPTGGGKSICYQIPALTLEGTTIVLSPLIALMKDQVEALSKNGVPAAFINSTLDSGQLRNVENAVLSGHIKILYVSPEKLVSQSFQPLLKRLKISLFAIDEAHCISAWGHDFRPEYTQLRFLKEQYPQVPILALTATADKLTRKDILEQLQLKDPALFIASFDRPNISLRVSPGQKRFEQIVDFLKKRPGQSGIIYCLARKTCQDLAAKLSAKGFKTGFYHAELSSAERSKVQEDFKFDRTPVICATIAFGMGIDKSNVRFVIHYNLPRNLEGYYQEIGRAGRDSLPSEALLFFSYADVMTYRDMIEQGDSSPEQKELKLAKLNRMYQFAEAPVCRRKTVLNYFGEPHEDNCGNCDVCKNPPRQFDGTVAAQKALSAILRTQEAVGMNLLVDILRGSQRRDIFEQGYHNIKTYGQGREFTFDNWIFLLSQMLHQGLIEIAYDDYNRLKVTDMGRSVLFDGKKVALALPEIPQAPEPKAPAAGKAEKGEKTEKTPRADRTPALKGPSAAELLREALLPRLIAVRRQVAQDQGVPPYVVFSDATLQDMAEKRPYTQADLLTVSGVGENKLKLYGDAFLNEIRQFIVEKLEAGERILGSSPLQSWELYRQGNSIEEIGQMRGYAPTTILGHLASMYERGEELALDEWVTPEEIDLITGALPLFEAPYQMKPIHEHFQERYSFDAIRFALAAHQRKANGFAED